MVVMANLSARRGDRLAWRRAAWAWIVVIVASCASAPTSGEPPSGPASTPEARTVDGVRLVPVSGTGSERCAEHARPFPHPAPCPLLLPGPTQDVLWCNGCEPGESFNVEVYSRGPAGYEGADGRGVHLVIEARDAAGWTRRVLCRGAETAGWTPVRGNPRRWMRCPDLRMPGRHSGHIALVWMADGATYAVSLHGQTPTNRRVAVVLARHLVMRP